MSYKSVVISSGHSEICRGASGVIDEVTEARKVVDKVAEKLIKRGVKVKTFHDMHSTSQSQNLSTICDFHNAQDRELDISVHFNAYLETSQPVGVEVLFVSQEALAGEVSKAIADAARFINRGAKLRTDLAFLNGTNQKSILVETCFVDSEKDADLYGRYFEEICEAIAETLCPSGGDAVAPSATGTFQAKGKVSHFGGPEDMGVSPSEGLALPQKIEDRPELFLPYQPANTTGLARRLNPWVPYVACRWNYDETPKSMLLAKMAIVRTPTIEMLAFPADWGPHEEKTGRAADISPGLMSSLGITTDDTVEVIFPAPED